MLLMSLSSQPVASRCRFLNEFDILTLKARCQYPQRWDHRDGCLATCPVVLGVGFVQSDTCCHWTLVTGVAAESICKTIGPAGPFGFWSDVKLLLCLHLRISFDLVVVVWKMHFAVRFQCTSLCEVSQE